jgi:putative NADPH-quinone reductase
MVPQALSSLSLARIKAMGRPPAHDMQMDAQRILIVQGHPDPAGGHLGHLLADAYAEGAASAGHTVQRVDVASLDFPILRTQQDWLHGTTPPALVPVQDQVRWARHLVFLFPLWLGDMPALLKAFLEQLARPSLAGEPAALGGMPPKALKGRSARVVVTMGMPALVYRWLFRAHSVKSLERNILGIMGVSPVHETLIGGVDQLGTDGLERWQRRMQALGRRAD